MKFKLPSLQVDGATRERKWFAILPVTIKGHVRWLEIVNVKQRYAANLKGGIWCNIMFIN